MTKSIIPKNFRILVVDDNPSIHEDFRHVLLRDDSHLTDLDDDAAALFGSGYVPARTATRLPFEVDSAFQGEEALELVREACGKGRPYALAFIDMRMPPGWDGLTTIQKLWEVDTALQIVICTAFSDRSWGEIQRTLTARDRWMVVKKPFDQIEVLQLAHALTEKWNLEKSAEIHMQNLEVRVEARTQGLGKGNRDRSEVRSRVALLRFVSRRGDHPSAGCAVGQCGEVHQITGCGDHAGSGVATRTGFPIAAVCRHGYRCRHDSGTTRARQDPVCAGRWRHYPEIWRGWTGPHPRPATPEHRGFRASDHFKRAAGHTRDFCA